MTISCTCGNIIQVAPSAVGKTGSCLACQRMVRLVTAGPAPTALDGDFRCRLVIEEGPQLAGAQFFLGGDGPIHVGKLADREICLPSPDVSRNHCVLRRVDDVWQVEDLGSKNGTMVNGELIALRDLQNGDFIRIANFEVLYLCPVEPIVGEPTEQEKALEAARLAALNRPKAQPKGIFGKLLAWLEA